MPGPKRSTSKLVVLAPLALLVVGPSGCGSHEIDAPAPPLAAATSIPVGAPGAQGVSFTPPPATPPVQAPTVEEKIHPDPSVQPFGLPPPAPDDGGTGATPPMKINPKGGMAL